MVKHSEKKSRPVFVLEPLRARYLEEIAGWVKMPRHHTYYPLWHNDDIDIRVMTANGRPVFLFNVLGLDTPSGPGSGHRRAGHLYLLCSPLIYRRQRLLLAAWHAATIYAYLQFGLTHVEASVNASALEENKALAELGYTLQENVTGASGQMKVYSCPMEEFRVAM